MVACLTMIVLTTLHANQENVSTPVLLLMSVLQMPIVELQDIRQYAHVQMDILVCLIYLVLCVSWPQLIVLVQQCFEVFLTASCALTVLISYWMAMMNQHFFKK